MHNGTVDLVSKIIKEININFSVKVVMDVT